MERLHVSVSRRSLFPLLMALFGALLCIGMVQRFRDPLYDMTLEYWLYLAAGCFMVLVGLVGMRFFPWMCIIPAVCYVYGGVIEGWADLQASGSSGLLTQIPFYQILMLVPLILLLMIRWKPWCIWLLKGLEDVDPVCQGMALVAIARCPVGIAAGGLFDRCCQANPLDAFSDE